MMSVETDITKVKEQMKSMLIEAQTLHENVISKVNKLYQDIQSDIEEKFQSQILLMSQYQEKIKAMNTKLESSMNDVKKLQGKHIDTTLFLKIQGNINDIYQITGEFTSVNQSLLFVDLSFNPTKIIQDVLSTSFTLGSVSTSLKKQATSIVVNDVVFPSALQPPNVVSIVPQQQSHGHVSGATGLKIRPLPHIKATKQCESNVKIKGDKKDCDIKGMALTKDGRILMTDNKNDKVKLFSPDMKFLSSVSVPNQPWDEAVISDTEAAATTNKSLVLLNISGSQLRIKTTTKVPYDISGITKYKNKFLISSDSPTPSVKLIDRAGKVYWSVSSDQQGEPLFRSPWHLTSHDDGRSSTVTVTDWGTNTLTLLNGETGDVIARRRLQEKMPYGVTTDTVGNVYVCYWWTRKVSVLSGDLSEEKILLSRQDGLSGRPLAIVYDDTTHKLFISYFNKDSVDCFELS